MTVGLAAGGRFPKLDILPYVGSQVVGAVIAAAVLYAVAVGAPGFVVEVVLTMMFLFIIMGATHGKAPVGFGPLAIGLGLTLIHLVRIPVTNTSVNPARGTGPAPFVHGWALAQLWMFWLTPLIGGALGGILDRWLSEEPAALVTGVMPAIPAE